MSETTTDPKVVAFSSPVPPATNQGPAAESGQVHAGPVQAGAPRQQKPFGLSDVQIGGQDCRGHPITEIYAAQPGEYTVYQADNEVMVHFSDERGVEQNQRKLILPLSRDRAKIRWLVQGLACRAVYDRQLAYALALALESDLADATLNGAKDTIADVRDTLVKKREARGQFQYLQFSTGSAVLLGGLLFIAKWSHFLHPDFGYMWLATKAGLVGAAFSIALAIRKRTVAPDTDWLANLTDGTLRLVIGVISAGVLLLLLQSGVLPKLSVGGVDFNASVLTPQLAVVIGFVGGFLERLVPDLLEKESLLIAPAGSSAAKQVVADQPAPAASGRTATSAKSD